MPETIKAVFVYSVWETEDRDFCVCQYLESDTGKRFVGIGKQLPNIKNLPMNLVGDWEISKKTGRQQFRVQYSEKAAPDSRAEVVAYLTSLKCGVGLIKAQKIYDKFGDKSWEILDNRPYDLVTKCGFSKPAVDKIVEALNKDNLKRNLIKLFSEAGITVSGSTAHEIVKKYGDDTLIAVRCNPFDLCSLHGFDFSKADILAEHLGYPKNDQRRITAATYEMLERAANSGHVCVPHDILIPEVVKFTGCGEEEVKAAVRGAIRAKTLRGTNGSIYTAERYNQEVSIAVELKRLLSATSRPIEQIDAFIDDYERANFKLADSQREAVRNVFRHNVSIITGGPGVGKTTVVKAVLAVHQGVFGASSDPILLAPTGKAARRMSEATGFPAQTIHSAIGWMGDDLPCNCDEPLNGNLILVDEVSMMDQSIASYLFKSIKTGSKVVLIGDIDQLPSVGCGNVLHDMIDSQKVPTTRLTVIFRQSGENPIVANSHAINEGKVDLQFGNDFRFYQAKNEDEIFRAACKAYEKKVKEVGMEKVILLNPQRRNTSVSVEAFNKELQERLNPPSENKKEVMVGKRIFRVGDKVIELKNTECAKNGDTGYITDIVKRADDPESKIGFNFYCVIEWNGGNGQGGTTVEYNMDDMKHVDLAYCMTVHKSQGSEYDTVIEIVSKAHRSMLKRNLVYTGITRAKKQVILIGELDALEMSIKNDRAEDRFTNLAARIYCS